MSVDDPVDDDNERPGRAANLDSAATQQWDQEAGHNRSHKSGLWVGPGRNGDGNAERQGH